MLKINYYIQAINRLISNHSYVRMEDYVKRNGTVRIVEHPIEQKQTVHFKFGL